MSADGNDCPEQMETDGEDLRTTPDRPQISPALKESTEIDKGSSDHTENVEPQIAVGNSTETMPSNIMEKISEPPEISGDIEQNHLETNRVSVKEEPLFEVDHDMPIAKTPRHTSTSQCEHFSDMEFKTLLGTTMGIKDNKESDDNMHSNGNATKSALDAYLDGIETPIAPIRVKAEFSLPKTLLRGASEEDSEAVPFLQPPPPPTFSSNANLDFVADGIATPRISLAAISRLRVKSEFSVPPSTPQHTSEDMFGDHLTTETENREEPGEASPSISDEASDNEPIPDDFFDDLLHDKLKERIEEAQNDDLEEKYSVRLKELKKLKKLKKKQESRKKPKKSKKKSRKRSRSRTLSPSSKRSEGTFNDSFDLSNYDKNKRSRISPSRRDMASSSNYVHTEAVDQDHLRVDSGIRIKSEFSANVLESIAKESLAIENVEEIEEPLTPKQRRERAIKRSTNLLNYLKKYSGDNSDKFSIFPFVSTVRKLPTSQSYVQQQIYENRSPLHTVNNVSYKFNSHATRFNMEEWGLAALPPHAAKMAKLVGCDAQFIYNKLKTIKIPAKLKKVKQEPGNDAEKEEEEELVETNSSLYSNAMTQTDDISEFDTMHKAKCYEIGVQVEPSLYSIGCQTLETQSPTEESHKGVEAPIMKIMHDLNENQLMAIHAFAELIKQPNANANAMEMYKVQMQILDIYKMSQIPSALLSAQNPIVNNYTTMTTKYGNHSPQISIESVKGADGKQFSVNDPRAKSATYARRNDASSYDSRYSNSSQFSNPRGSTNESYSQPPYSRSSGNGRGRSVDSNNSPSLHLRQSPASSPGTGKHYGRGGLRR